MHILWYSILLYFYTLVSCVHFNRYGTKWVFLCVHYYIHCVSVGWTPTNGIIGAKTYTDKNCYKYCLLLSGKVVVINLPNINTVIFHVADIVGHYKFVYFVLFLFQLVFPLYYWSRTHFFQIYWPFMFLLSRYLSHLLSIFQIFIDL